MKKVLILILVGTTLTLSSQTLFKDSYIIAQNVVDSYKFSSQDSLPQQDRLVYQSDFTGNADDLSGNGNDGTVNGATLTTGLDGSSNSAYDFNGTTDYIEFDGVITDLSGTTGGTFSVWIKPVDITKTNAQNIFTFGDTDGDENIQFFIRGGNTGAIGVLVRDAGVTQVFESTNNDIITAGVWSHVVVTQVQSSSPAIYINNVSVTLNDIATTDIDSWFYELSTLDNARIGDYNVNNSGESFFFDGDIDEPLIYDVELSSSEISEIYNLQAP